MSRKNEILVSYINQRRVLRDTTGVARGIGISKNGRSPAFRRPFRGKENISPCGRVGLRGQGGSILPSWYPRKPLSDITAVMKAIQRRKACRVEGGEGLETKSPELQEQTVHDPSAPVAQLEQDISATSPLPMAGKVLLITATQAEGNSTCITPQRKLFNNMETVERVVMEELQILKRTPAVKKAEREKKVRTLMSLR